MCDGLFLSHNALSYNRTPVTSYNPSTGHQHCSSIKKNDVLLCILHYRPYPSRRQWGLHKLNILEPDWKIAIDMLIMLLFTIKSRGLLMTFSCDFLQYVINNQTHWTFKYLISKHCTHSHREYCKRQ